MCPLIRFLWALRTVAALPWLAVVLLFSSHALCLPVPPLTGRVVDNANILSDAVEQKLTARLAGVEQQMGRQLAILTVPSLEGDPIEDFSMRVVEEWKLGKKGKDDGVLLLIAVNDHKMRIEVGYGLEGELPDVAAGRIINDVMAPRFRAGDYDGGVTSAISAILVKIGAGTAEDAAAAVSVTRTPQSTGSVLGTIFKLLVLAPFIIFFILASVLRRLFGGSRTTYYGGGGYYSSRGSSYGGGGSSFSGGGGSFGGGGASGSW